MNLCKLGEQIHVLMLRPNHHKQVFLINTRIQSLDEQLTAALLHKSEKSQELLLIIYFN